MSPLRYLTEVGWLGSLSPGASPPPSVRPNSMPVRLERAGAPPTRDESSSPMHGKRIRGPLALRANKFRGCLTVLWHHTTLRSLRCLQTWRRRYSLEALQTRCWQQSQDAASRFEARLAAMASECGVWKGQAMQESCERGQERAAVHRMVEKIRWEAQITINVVQQQLAEQERQHRAGSIETAFSPPPSLIPAFTPRRTLAGLVDSPIIAALASECRGELRDARSRRAGRGTPSARSRSPWWV